MAVEVVIPMLGVTVERGTVQEWLKKEGDSVVKGEILFIVETEKVTTEVESPAAGILGKILVPIGVEVPILTVAAILLNPGEALPETAAPQTSSPAQATPEVQSTPAAVSAPVALGPGVTEVVLPMLGITVEKGTITQWLKKEGDAVEKGDILYIVESEKVTTEVESPAAGTLANIIVGEGIEVPLLTPVAYIVAPGASFSMPQASTATVVLAAAMPSTGGPCASSAYTHAAPASTATPAGACNGTVKAMPAARKLAADNSLQLSRIAPTGPNGVILHFDVQNALAGQPCIKASSLAKNIAAQQGVDLGTVEGTGARGRVMSADVTAASVCPSAQATGKTTPAVTSGPQTPRIVPMNSTRKVIARRMCESMFGAPHIVFFCDVTLDPLLAYRKQVLPAFEAACATKISINDFLIKAVGSTLRQFPEMNASCVNNDSIHYFDRIHVGLAVSAKTGLIVPAITDADSSGLVHITTQRADLVARARDGKLTMDELTRGTFTISSLAQSSVRQFTAIINPPQSAILSVPMTRDELYMDNGTVKQRNVTSLGLSVDHRIVDGSMAADFMKALKERLENPAFAFLTL